ncbi:reverse transcriptase domain-containing protein [Tanacetum coccineum]
MTPIIKYLEEGIVPSDNNEARALRAKIGQYTMESGVLFKKGYLIPMCERVGPLQANYVIREIHMGSCGMHVGPRAVVRKAMRQVGNGHTWSLTPARGGAKFVVVAIDYFTKWVEAKPLVKITGKEIIRFVMDNIICRYGLPRIIVTDNGAQLSKGQTEALWKESKPVRKGKSRMGRRIAEWRSSTKKATLEPGLTKERREAAAIREARTKSKMNINTTRNTPGRDLWGQESLCKSKERGKQVRSREAGSQVGRPYMVTKKFENGLLQVANNGDQIVPRTWALDSLTKCYL